MIHDQQHNEPVDYKNNSLTDSSESFSSCVNSKSSDNVVTAEDPITMDTNAGNKTLNKFGVLSGFRAKMWKDPTGIANALSFAELANQCHIKHDDMMEDAFQVKECNNGDESIKFKCDCASNLCHFKFLGNHINGDCQFNSQLVETVAENQKNCSAEQCERV